MDAIIANRLSSTAETTTEPPSSLLILILDTAPTPWYTLSTTHTLPLLPTAISQLLLFVNAHLALSQENRVAVLAAHCGATHWLYPAPSITPSSASDTSEDSAIPTDANKYRPFAVIEHTIVTRLTALLSATTTSDVEADAEPPVAGALTLALSYVNRTITALGSQHPTNISGTAAVSLPTDDRGHGESTPTVLDARVLVVSVSGDLAGQYIPLMNSMFAAQHLRVPIDVLKLAGDSVLLQQCSDTTGGIFITPANSPAALTSVAAQSNGATSSSAKQVTLLPALFQSLLPTPSTRAHLNPPKTPSVDFRAACFCHRRVVDMGFVCSICLSIFCDEGIGVDVGRLGAEAGKGVQCLTCGSALILAGRVDEGEGEGTKKKKKKKRKEGE